MAQTPNFNIPANLSGTAFRTQTIEKLTALLTQNSGNTEPSNPKGGMLWLDTSNATTHYLKLRNASNNAWGIVCVIDVATGSIKNGYSTVEIDALLDSKLNKTELEVSSAINKGVRRDSNGFIWTGYINSNMGEDSSLANATSSLIFRNSDGFLRQMSQTKLREILNVYTKTEVNNLALNAAKTNTQNTFSAAQIFNGELSGLAFSSTSAANKVVKRDNNGDFVARHITADHFNMINALQDNLATTASEVMYRNSSDNFLRAMSLAKLKEVLGLVSILEGLQVRIGSYVADANKRINFATAFPNKCLFVYTITGSHFSLPSGDNTRSPIYGGVASDKAGFTAQQSIVYIRNTDSKTYTYYYTANYLALGY